MYQSVSPGGTNFRTTRVVQTKAVPGRRQPCLTKLSMRWGLGLLLVACNSGNPPSSAPRTSSDAGSAADAAGTASTADTDGNGDGSDTRNIASTADNIGTTNGGEGSANGPDEEGDAGAHEDEDDPVDPDGALGPEVRVAPSIVGDAIEGKTLAASFGGYSAGATLEGVWQRCADGTCQTAANAEDEAGYTLRAADVGCRMRLVVTATDDEGVTVAVSPSTDVVVAAGEVVNTKPPSLGDAFVFRPLELTAGTWLGRVGITRHYQWQRCVDATCEDIPDANGLHYTPAVADLGMRLRVIETVTRNDESAEDNESADASYSATSNETDEVTCAEPLASEPIGAASAVNLASGVAWTFTEGGFPAIAEAIGPAKRSALLVSHSFGYALGESRVQGVEVRVTRRASGALSLRDQRVALYAPAARTKAPDSMHWSSDSVTAVYGGPTDTWGQEISTAVVNSSQLRFALAVENTAEKASNAIIEDVEVVVYYEYFDSSVFDATTVSEGDVGSAWASAASAVSEDGAVATLSISTDAPVTSRVLTFGGFGVTLPSDVVPSGYALEVLQSASPGLLLSSSMQAGTITEIENQLPNTLGYVRYGGPDVTWGLASDEVTSSSFSAQHQVMGQGLPLSGSVEVDAVRLRVYFGAEVAEAQRSATVLETTSNEAGWSNVGNVLADDDEVTTTTALSDQRVSGSLVLRDFAPVVPEGAAISGVALAVRRSASAADQLQDVAVFLRTAAGIIGANRASSEFWPIARETVIYGGPHDRWGASLRASDVNSGTFGAELTVAHASTTGAAVPEVDSALLTVHYCTE